MVSQIKSQSCKILRGCKILLLKLLQRRNKETENIPVSGLKPVISRQRKKWVGKAGIGSITTSQPPVGSH